MSDNGEAHGVVMKIGALEVCIAAEEWWIGRRPPGWTLEQHIASPTINTASDVEAELAMAVAEAMG